MPLLCRPVKARLTPGARAPLTGSTAASPLRAVAFTCVKAPATYSSPLATTRSSTVEPVVTSAAKPPTTAPAASNATSRWWVVPFTAVKSPPTNSEVPSVASAFTGPSSDGLKVLEISPVVVSKAKR